MAGNTKRLLCIMAHPDDETLGTGGILAKYAAQGVETYLVTATRGQRGWFGDPDDYPGPEALGKMREAELHAAADALGLQAVTLLDYMDGELDQAKPEKITHEIAAEIRRIQPDIVVTFDPTGAYGHPDHIAISQFTMAAVVAAADADYETNDAWNAHRVSKLYYMLESQSALEIYQSVFGELMMSIDGVERRAVNWPEWSSTAHVPTGDYYETVWEAVRCHRTQLPGYEKLLELPDEVQRQIYETQHYYRAFSFVNGGRQVETDLFEGIA